MASHLKSVTPAKASKSSTTTSKVRVVVRVRPFLAHEIVLKEENQVPCASILDDDAHFDFTDEVSVHLKDQNTSRQECFKLDGFYGQDENNIARIYEKEVEPLISGIFQGCNSTVFAYGATGSGKTYTMQGTDLQPGLIQLAMSAILSMCEATGCIAEISYYEVYLDRCYDLLELKANEISVLDDKEGQIHLKGLSRVLVTSMFEFQQVFARGVQRRKVAHTGLNDVSSRSHGVLVVTISKPSNQEKEASIIGKLNLIDLAGNEDNRRSGNEGIRLQESAKINQSLFALSNVIYALNNNKPWVPYRESKLTRLLQDSLGGTSRALMVACLNPGDYQEAVYTVSLAARSRKVSNLVSLTQKQETPKVKIDMEAKLQAWLESKGKIRSAQRKDAFSSPFHLKSPSNRNCMNKQAVLQSSVKEKSARQRITITDSFMSMPPSKLFDGEVASDSFQDDSACAQELQDLKNLTISGENEVVANDIEHHTVNATKVASAACLPDESFEKNEENKKAGNFCQSPPNRPHINGCQSPTREALTPVNSNITKMKIKEVSSRDDVLSLLLDSDAPKTPFILMREKFQDCNTPLDRFNARSSNLKSYLVQEYIDFLNTATREELVELKGIGVKRAEYIIELRESSPLKSLSDLEKIGLSYKQVQHLFSKAAKHVFE
ncbi:unnamed protein product [Amaranthus hypochondriacus]